MKQLILSALTTGPKTPIELFNLCKFGDPYVFAQIVTQLTQSKKIERRVTVPNHDTVYHSITVIPDNLIKGCKWEDIRVEYRLTTKQ